MRACTPTCAITEQHCVVSKGEFISYIHLSIQWCTSQWCTFIAYTRIPCTIGGIHLLCTPHCVFKVEFFACIHHSAVPSRGVPLFIYMYFNSYLIITLCGKIS